MHESRAVAPHIQIHLPYIAEDHLHTPTHAVYREEAIVAQTTAMSCWTVRPRPHGLKTPVFVKLYSSERLIFLTSRTFSSTLVVLLAEALACSAS